MILHKRDPFGTSSEKTLNNHSVKIGVVDTPILFLQGIDVAT